MIKFKNSTLFLLCLTLVVSLSSCEAIGTIFKAGLWVGIIIVVIVVALILWLIGKARK
jgi:hypothetical protein